MRSLYGLTSLMQMEYRELDITVTNENIEKDAHHVLKAIRPQWKKEEVIVKVVCPST